MININKRLSNNQSRKIDDHLELPFDLRQKSRLRVTLSTGREAALFLDRGTIMRGGDLLETEAGDVIEVVAAHQAVTDVTAKTAQALMCAAYHLGNRHVPLQVGDGWLRLEQDHVLNEMLVGLGMITTDHNAPFEPEAGAYGGGHRHGGDDDNYERLPSKRLKPNA